MESHTLIEPHIAGGRVVALSRFRADVAKAAQRRGERLLEGPDLAGRMATLAPLEAYFVIKELGLEAALPLLRHASAAQLQAFVDLDCWDEEGLAVDEVDAWLAAFVEGGPEVLAEAFGQLDEEVQTLFLARSVAIFDARSESVLDEAGVPQITTMDQHFVVQLRRGCEGREVHPFLLLDAMYRREPSEAARLLMNAKWELPASLEEEARHFRQGRCEDLGFPDAADAARLFARPPALPPEPLAPAPLGLPGVYAAGLQDDALFTQAMNLVAGHALLERLEAELVLLVNAAVVAYGGSPRDIRHVGEVAERVRDTLSLGLEALAEADGDEDNLARAAARLEMWPLLHLFQWGHAQVRPLQEQARAVAHRAPVAAWLAAGEVNDDDVQAAQRAFLLALTATRPLRAGLAGEPPGRRRAFASLAQVEAARRRLDELGA